MDDFLFLSTVDTDDKSLTTIPSPSLLSPFVQEVTWGYDGMVS